MGRPSKLTPDRQAKICNAIMAGATFDAASEAAGVDYSTFARWMEKGRNSRRGRYYEFCEAVRAAEARGQVILVARIQEASKDEWRAAAWMLERRHRKDFGPNINITGMQDDELDRKFAEVSAALSQAGLLRDDSGIPAAGQIGPGDSETDSG